jgi:hypothetical protein
MIIRETILIHASMKKVWDTFTDLTSWKHWNTVMENVKSEESYLADGKVIKCCFRPFLFPVKVRIRIEETVPYERVVWSARKKGLFAFHEFLFEEHKNGVLVTSKETFSGLLTAGSGFLLPMKRMRSLTKAFLKELKRAADTH